MFSISVRCRYQCSSEPVEFAVQPGLEGGAAVIEQHTHLLEDLGDSLGADPQGAHHR
jgi:hypothetical protein